MTGHLLTAAAAVEALACLAAMERRALPPTINLDHPDPECDLCHVANEPKPTSVRVAVSNSFGFGGSNTCLVLRRLIVPAFLTTESTESTEKSRAKTPVKLYIAP